MKRAPAVWVHRPGLVIEPEGVSMQVEPTRLYRVREVAEHFDVSVATIYRAIESGQLVALKLGTGIGTFRVPGAAVLAYGEACEQAAGGQSEADSTPAVVAS